MHTTRPRPSLALLLLLGMAVAVVRPLDAQCPLRWQQPGEPLPYASGYVVATTARDPDGPGPATALLVVGGELYAGGVEAPYVARWDGSARSAVDSPSQRLGGIVYGLLALKDGDLVAGGARFAFLDSTRYVETNLARLGGGRWTSMDVHGRLVAALACDPSDALFVAGDFTAAGGQVAGDLALLQTTFPATVVAYGSGCAGSAGQLILTPTRLPWIGGSYRATVSGLAPGSAALDMLGFGAAEVEHAVPNDPALVGAVLRDQVLQVEFGPGPSVAARSSTNGLRLTCGVF